MERENIGAVYIIMVMLVACAFAGGFHMGQAVHQDTVSVKIDSVRDTIYTYKTDTLPVEVSKTVMKLVHIPVVHQDTVRDTLTLPLVQKVFTDTLYKAYVSGLDYGEWPKLDSISVRSQTITNTITKTVTIRKKPPRWSVGAQAGYGYGFRSQYFEPYIGLGVSYNIYP